MSLKNKIILITGGSSGIGLAAAKQLHQLGATIILQARSLDKLKSAAFSIHKQGERVHYYCTDLIDSSEVISDANKIIQEVGLPDIVINSAGSGEWLSFQEANMDHFKQTINSPYLATTYTCKAFYDKMQSRGNGDFIIINSAGCFFAFPGATGYLPARWALLGFSKALQADLRSTNFNVSMIALGKVDSPYFKNNPVSEERIPKVSEMIMSSLTVEEAGKIIVRTVLKPKNTVIKPRMMQASVFLNKFFPSVFSSLMRMK